MSEEGTGFEDGGDGCDLEAAFSFLAGGAEEELAAVGTHADDSGGGGL